MNEPDPGPIRVCLVDDHAVVRRGLRGYLDLVEDIEVVGEAGDGQAALDTVAALVAEQRAPHVVLMDLLMPGLDGVTATRLLTQQYEDIAVMAMTSYSEVERIRSALEAGASGYLLKDAEADEVADGIRKAHRREMPLGAVVSRQLARAFSATGQADTAADSVPVAVAMAGADPALLAAVQDSFLSGLSVGCTVVAGLCFAAAAAGLAALPGRRFHAAKAAEAARLAEAEAELSPSCG